MNLGLAILLIIIALAGGVLLGMFIARKQVEKMIGDLLEYLSTDTKVLL